MYERRGQFRECPDCGDHIDAGEICDCKKEKRRISETLVIGFDSAYGEDFAALSVARHDGINITILSTFCGKEAEDLYDKLTSYRFVSQDVKEPKTINKGELK